MSASTDDPARGDERRVALTLAIAVLAAVALLAAVRSLTAERAAIAAEAMHVESLEAVLEGVAFDLVTSVALLTPDGSPMDAHGPLRVHRVRRDGRTVAAVLGVVTPDGYSGAIELLVGVLADGSISGVRVLSHRETPGLGDRIERRRSDWITRFEGRSLEPESANDAPRHEWRVTRSGEGGTFDALSGATITSRAVVDAVHRALVGLEAREAEVFR